MALADPEPEDPRPVDETPGALGSPPARAPRSQLRDEASSYIRSLILSGQVSPGQYVRLEPLARTLQMSATPVREALLSLRDQGFLELHPNRGFAVVEISPRDVADLFLVQAFAAGELAARAAEQLTPELVHRLDRLGDDLDRHVRQGDERALEVTNDEFHALINRGADSPRLAWFYAEAIPIVPRRFLTLVPGWIDATRRSTGPWCSDCASTTRRGLASRCRPTSAMSASSWPITSRPSAGSRRGRGEPPLVVHHCRFG